MPDGPEPKFSLKSSGLGFSVSVLIVVGVPAFLFSFLFLRGFAPTYAYGLAFGLTGAGYFLSKHLAEGRTYLRLALKAPVVISLAAAASIACSLLTVGPRPPTPYFEVWSSIPQGSYLTFLEGALATFFFPGFFVVYLLRGGRKLGLLGTLVFSFVVSYFIDNLLSLFLVLHEGGFGSSNLAVGVVNVGLATTAAFYSVFFDREGLTLEVDDAALSLASITATFGFLFYAVNYAGNIPFLKGDLFTLFGEALRYLQPGWQAATNVTYPQGFFWNLALLLNETSFPYMNAAVLSIGLVLLLPAAVAFAAYGVSGDKGVALFATLALALFGPLFWVFYFDYTNVYSLANPGLSIPFYTWDFKDTTAGIVCTIPLLALAIGRLGLKWWTRSALIFTALFAAVFAHIVEPVVAIGAFLPVALFQPSRPFREKAVTGVSMALALGASALLARSVGMGSVVVGSAILAGGASLLLLVAGAARIPALARRVAAPVGEFARGLTRAKALLAVAIIYLYGLSLFVFVLFPALNVKLAVWTYGVVPTGFWWLALGLPLPALVAGYAVGLFEDAPDWVPSVVAASMMSLFVVLAFGFLNTQTTITVTSALSGSGVPTAVPTGILAWRLLIILFVPVGILFAFASRRFGGILAKGRARKYLLPAFVIALILLGIPSSVVEARSLIGNQGAIQASAFKYTVPELNATAYMSSKLPLNSVVMTMTIRASELVSAGERNVRALSNLSPTALGAIIGATHDPGLVLSLLRYYNVSYIFVDQFDYAQEFSTPVYGSGMGYLIKYLLPLLPVVYSNSGNVIYSVPDFGGASSPRGASLVVPFSQDSNFYSLATLLSMYTSYSEQPYSQVPSGHGIMVLPYDPLPSLQAGNAASYRAETNGDSIVSTTAAVDWVLNSTNDVPHTLLVHLGEYYALSQTQSITFQMLASGPSLSCDINSTGRENVLLTSFSPSNRTVTVNVASQIESTFTGMQFTCTPKSGNGTTTLSIGPLSFGVPADTQASSYLSGFPQQSNLSNYLSWVKSGGELVVADPGLPLGYFGHFMGLEEGGPVNVTGISAPTGPLPGDSSFNSTYAETITTANASAPLIWYTSPTSSGASPLLVKMPLGNGSIFWLQLGPLLHELDSGAFTLQQAYAPFADALSAASPTDPGTTPPTFDAILAGQDTLQGKLQVTGGYFIPSVIGQGLNLLSGSQASLRNFTLENVYGSGITWSVLATSATLGASTMPGLVRFTFGDGANITVGPSGGGQIILNGIYDGAPVNVTLASPVTLSTGANISMMIESPAVSLFGTLTSTRAYVTNQFLPQIPFPPYGGSFFRSGGEFKAQGSISLTASSYRESVVSNLSGSWTPVDPNPQGTWTISKVGWVNTLVSQGDLMILVAVVVFLLVRPVVLSRAKAVLAG